MDQTLHQRWMRPKHAVRALQISDPTLWRRVREGKLQARKLDGTTYINVGEFFEKLEREGSDA